MYNLLADSTPQITIYVYGHDKCGYTRGTRRDLTNANIPFVYKKIRLFDEDNPTDEEIAEKDAASNEMWRKVRASSWYEGGSVGLAIVDVEVDGNAHVFERPSVNDDIKPLLGL